jgi:phospholipase C
VSDQSSCNGLIIIIGLLASFLFVNLFAEPACIMTKVFAATGDENATVKSNTPIKHVIVISQGKRSFDNYFGTFPAANGFPAGIAVPLNPYPNPLVEFAVSVWFMTNSTFSKDAILVNKGGVGVDTAGQNMNYGVWMSPLGKIFGGFETTKGRDYTVGTNLTYNDGRWHNAIVNYDGKSNLELFVDGNLTATNKTEGATPDPSPGLPLRIGANSLYPDNFFSGSVDEIRIWNRPLQNSEVLQGFHKNIFDMDGQLAYLSFGASSDINHNSSRSISSGSAFQLDGIYLNGSSYKDVRINSTNDSSQNTIKPYNIKKSKTQEPFDSSTGYKVSYNNGAMDGFLFAQSLNGHDPALVMGYYNQKQIPYYWRFASEFVLADNFFAPTMETGLANHQYLYTGTGEDYQKSVPFRGYINLNKTIFDELEKKGISWKVYSQNYDPGLNYTKKEFVKNRYVNLLPAVPRFVDNKTLNSHIVDLVEYFRDLRGSDFPSVAYISAPDSDDSAPNDISEGQKFVASLVIALMKSKNWNDSAFIITYRESGGWYDHMPPPIENSQTYGFRVPTMIISPYAKKNYVDSTLYDVTSILKFIEYNYGLSPLAKRDANANNMLNVFNFTQSPTKPIDLSSGLDLIAQKIKNSATGGSSVRKVNLIYLTIVSAIPLLGLVVWFSQYIAGRKLGLIQRK